MRIRKWWWSILSLAVGIMLTNVYIMYIKINLKNGKQKNKLLSHHDFKKYIALVQVNPSKSNATFPKPVENIITQRKRPFSVSSTSYQESLLKLYIC